MGIAHHPLLQLARVSGRDAQGPASQPLGSLFHVSVTLEPGVHAFVGRPADGTAALCEFVSGRRSPSVGVVSVRGHEPHRHAATRRRMAAVLPTASSLPGRTVVDALTTMGQLRGAALAECLTPFGAAGLAHRRVSQLGGPEARAVELAAALSLAQPLVLVLFEPLGLAALAEDVVRERVRAAAAGGACVVIVTATPELLGSLADHVYLLESGRLWGSDREVGWCVGPADPALPVGEAPALHSITLWLSNAAARALVGSLGERPEVVSVSVELAAAADAASLAELRVAGPDVDALALAVADVVAATHTDVMALAGASPTLETLQRAARARRQVVEANARLVPPTSFDAADAVPGAAAVPDGLADAVASPRPDVPHSTDAVPSEASPPPQEEDSP